MCLLAICISSSFSLLPFSLAAPWGRWDFSNKNKPMAQVSKIFFKPRGKFGGCCAVQSLSHVQIFATPWTAARQASLSKFGEELDITVHCSITVHFLRCNNNFVVM